MTLRHCHQPDDQHVARQLARWGRATAVLQLLLNTRTGHAVLAAEATGIRQRCLNLAAGLDRLQPAARAGNGPAEGHQPTTEERHEHP